MKHYICANFADYSKAFFRWTSSVIKACSFCSISLILDNPIGLKMTILSFNFFLRLLFFVYLENDSLQGYRLLLIARVKRRQNRDKHSWSGRRTLRIILKKNYATSGSTKGEERTLLFKKELKMKECLQLSELEGKNDVRICIGLLQQNVIIEVTKR